MRIKPTHALIVGVAVLAGMSIFLIPDQLGDGELEEQVIETLRAIVDVDTGEVEVSVVNGEVTRGGPLPKHEMRRIVIEEVKKINGV